MTRGDQEPPANARIHEDAEAADIDPPPAAPEIEPERHAEIPQDIPQRPARNRRPPSTLNYASLGNPYVSCMQTTDPSVFVPPMLPWPPPLRHPFPCWTNPVYHHPSLMYYGTPYLSF